MQINSIEFNNYINDYYYQYKRSLKWRNEINPYYILISEFMLQQTQVSRVIDFFEKFINILPTLDSLANAEQHIVISLWSGLGYNRRALYLHHAAKTILYSYQGIIPTNYEELLKIKGIGEYTAKAIITYCYNIPLIFVETNIRSVFFIYFKDLLTNQKKIDDIIIKKLIEQLINQNNPRDWYYALMDLGTKLKKENKDKHIQKSKSFTKQSKFQGSNREIRGNIIKLLLKQKIIAKNDLINFCNDIRTEKCISELSKENFIIIDENNYIKIK